MKDAVDKGIAQVKAWITSTVGELDTDRVKRDILDIMMSGCRWLRQSFCQRVRPRLLDRNLLQYGRFHAFKGHDTSTEPEAAAHGTPSPRPNEERLPYSFFQLRWHVGAVRVLGLCCDCPHFPCGRFASSRIPWASLRQCRQPERQGQKRTNVPKLRQSSEFLSSEAFASPLLTVLLDIPWVATALSGWPIFGSSEKSADRCSAPAPCVNLRHHGAAEPSQGGASCST